MLNKGQGDLLRRPYLPLRHGANLRLRGFRNFYSHVDSYVEIVLVLPWRKWRKTSKGLRGGEGAAMQEPRPATADRRTRTTDGQNSQTGRDEGFRSNNLSSRRVSETTHRGPRTTAVPTRGSDHPSPSSDRRSKVLFAVNFLTWRRLLRL